MLILGQKACFLGPTIFEIPRQNWYYSLHYLNSKNSKISFEWVVFWAEIYIVFYASLGNSTTHITWSMSVFAKDWSHGNPRSLIAFFKSITFFFGSPNTSSPSKISVSQVIEFLFWVFRLKLSRSRNKIVELQPPPQSKRTNFFFYHDD